MRGWRSWAAVTASAVLMASGCSAGRGSDSVATGGATSVSSTVPEDAGPQVTVPGLGATTSDMAGTAASPSEPSLTTGSTAAPSSESAPTTGDVLTSTEATSPADPIGPGLICEGCAVLGEFPNIADGLSAALTTHDGRATLVAFDGTGAVRAAVNIPYGVEFPAPAGGQLGCLGGLCVIVATTADASAVLSAFAFESGQWTDLSGDSGFQSATAKGRAVPVGGSLGVAIQISDGTTTVWNVLVRNGAAFTTVGCAPDADSPDLAALSLTSCLS